MYDPAIPRSRTFVPAILSGLLLYAAYFPLNLGFLGWIALAPLLTLVRANARPRRIYLAAFVGGLFCYVPAIQWMRVAHPAMYASWMVLAVYCSIFLALSIALVRKLDRVGVPLSLAVPIAWVSLEYFRSHFPTGYTWLETVGLRHPIGFGWYLLGHTQHDWLSIIQIADLGGVYAVTFVVALVNVAVWRSAVSVGRLRTWLRLPGPVPESSWRTGLATAAVVLATVGYGLFRLNHDPFPDGPRVALVQGNLAQDLKNTRGDEMARHFGDLALQASRPPAGQPRPDLVVWPETSYLVPWFDAPANLPFRDFPDDIKRGYNGSRLAIREDMYFFRVTTLFGLNSLVWEGGDERWKYNSALLVNAQGDAQARYDKIHLVPWGEYVPLEQTFPFLKAFTPYEGDYSCKPGELWTRFPLKVEDRTYHFACLICYEDTDATLARTYVRPAAEGVDFLVNISNDGWFDGTAEHEQHLAIARFRAVESRRSMVRAVNMGISGIVDADGRVIALPGDSWQSSKKVEGIVRGAVPIDTRTTLYARLGDWLPLLGWLIVLGGFIRGFARRPAQVA